ncbi:hypothetical protein CRG98_009075 [Punica granatum]|uniref:Uncharacterized protein n=1 Tax=Punica granatum TaxID=22663 RepID=A0A2I0KQG7_PUNGR|nr:hypothetical protein CRG98_009075 [Punica granatum]
MGTGQARRIEVVLRGGSINYDTCPTLTDCHSQVAKTKAGVHIFPAILTSTCPRNSHFSRPLRRSNPESQLGHSTCAKASLPDSTQADHRCSSNARHRIRIRAFGEAYNRESDREGGAVKIEPTQAQVDDK